MPASQIFVLDDEPAFRVRVREGLGGMFAVVEAGSEEEFSALWVPQRFDLLLLDMRLRRDKEGLDVLREVFAQDELQPVIMVSAYGDSESAIEAVGAGAMMFLHKHEYTPALLGRMVEAVIEQGRLRRQVRGLRQLAWAGEPDTLLGDSPAVREAVAALRGVAGDLGQVPLISGERGTGASLAARMVHRLGERLDGPFVEVAGSAVQSGGGFFDKRYSPWVQASGGTLALDGVEEVGESEGRGLVRRLEDERMENSTPRVVFLQHDVGRSIAGAERYKSGRWLTGMRELVPVRLPALRERTEDVPLLAAHFLQRQRAGGHTTALSLGAVALDRLTQYDWPGNVRELRNAVEYGALQAAAVESAEVLMEHLPAALVMSGRRTGKSGAMAETGAWNYRFHLARTELELADRAIRERGIQQKTALGRALGYTDRFTLMRRIHKAMADFPGLGTEFMAVAKLFREGGAK